METQVEFRVRPVTRYIVTSYTREYDPTGASASSGKSLQHGEFDNFNTAHAVGYALANQEAARRELPPGDMRVIFPGAIDPSIAGVVAGGLAGFAADPADNDYQKGYEGCLEEIQRVLAQLSQHTPTE